MVGIVAVVAAVACRIREANYCKATSHGKLDHIVEAYVLEIVIGRGHKGSALL